MIGMWLHLGACQWGKVLGRMLYLGAYQWGKALSAWQAAVNISVLAKFSFYEANL